MENVQQLEETEMENLLPVQLFNAENMLRKHSGAIHISGDLTKTEHHMMNILYQYTQDSGYKKHNQIIVSDLCKHMNWDHTHYDRLKQSFEALSKSSLNWNIFDVDKSNRKKWIECGGIGFIASYVIDEKNGIIKYELSDMLIDILKSPSIFARIDLRIQSKLTSKRAIVWYEYFIEELCRNKKVEMITKMYSIGDIRRMHNIGAGKYDEPKRLIKNFIKEPIFGLKSKDEKREINSINAKTDINVEIHEIIKNSYYTVGYIFKIEYKDKTKININDMKEYNIKKDYNVAYDIKDELYIWFHNEDRTNKLIELAQIKYGDDYENKIRRNIEYVKNMDQNKNKIKNFAAYLTRAVEYDYADNGSENNLAEIFDNTTVSFNESKPQKTEADIKKKKEDEYKVKIDSLVVSIYEKLSQEKRDIYFKNYIDSCVEEDKKKDKTTDINLIKLIGERTGVAVHLMDEIDSQWEQLSKEEQEKCSIAEFDLYDAKLYFAKNFLVKLI